uniref:Barwin domain-containing protein n=1 Tax=Zooxanthella nutricula TaxID=1333877 RepID=A0A7S2P1C9_9DINO
MWTYYISYAPCCQGNPNYDPAAGTGECDYYNACQWSGYFAYKNGQQSFDWVKSNNLVAFYTVNGNNGDFASKRIRVQAAGKTIEAQIVDTCGDSDCNGCCSRNANKGGGNLVDMEYWTVMNNFGSTDVAYGDVCWQLV